MLKDGNSCFFSDEIPVYIQEEGKSVMVQCSVFVFEGRKLFCKERCEDGTILVETTDDTAHRGSYSIELKERPTSTYAAPYVTITHLKKSDSGRYRCLVTPSSVSVPYDDFEIVVKEAPTTTPPTSTPGPSPTTTFPPSSPPATTTPTLSSTSSSSSSEITELLAVSQPGTLLVVGVRTAVVVVVLLLSVVLLLVCKRKTGCSVCLKKRRSSDRNRTKVFLYENCSPVSTCEDSTYQSLSPATRDQDQTYSTLTETQQT